MPNQLSDERNMTGGRLPAKKVNVVHRQQPALLNVIGHTTILKLFVQRLKCGPIVS